MAVLTDRASKGNAKAVESLCMSVRGLVCWLISVLNGSYDAGLEKRIWENFLEDLKAGKVSAGDPIEKDLIGCAVSAFTGKVSSGYSEEGESLLNTIKFPGDLDAARGYINELIKDVPSESRASFILAVSGFGKKAASSILGISESEASSTMENVLETVRDSAKKIAAGKYNINIPAPEMMFDALTRIYPSFSAEGDPDSDIKAVIGAGFSAKPQETADEKGNKKRSKLIRYAVAALCVLLVVAFGAVFLKNRGNDPEGGTGTYDGSEDIDHGDDGSEEDDVKVIYHVTMEIKDYGTIELELDKSAAPRTVKNFVDLVKRGFYDGLTFHRIMDGFMIQGGDPLGNGTGGSDKKIIGEFSENGVDNPISHKRGTISMARASGDYNSARSQFFICQVDCSASLDGKYAAFGHVTSGMEIVDQICKDAKPTDDNGTIPKNEQPVIVSVKVTEEFKTE